MNKNGFIALPILITILFGVIVVGAGGYYIVRNLPKAANNVASNTGQGCIKDNEFLNQEYPSDWQTSNKRSFSLIDLNKAAGRVLTPVEIQQMKLSPESMTSMRYSAEKNGAIIRKFEISDARSFDTISQMKCGIYLSRVFNFDNKNGTPLAGYSREFWKYDYNGNGSKLFTFETNSTLHVEGVDANEKYVALENKGSSNDGPPLVFKDLKGTTLYTLDNDKVYNLNKTIPKSTYGNIPGEWGNDGNYWGGYISQDSKTVGYIFVKAGTWETEVLPTPSDLGNGAKAVNFSKGHIAYTDFPGIFASTDELKKMGDTRHLFLYNIRTKEKTILAESNNFNSGEFDPKWISATALEFKVFYKRYTFDLSNPNLNTLPIKEIVNETQANQSQETIQKSATQRETQSNDFILGLKTRARDQIKLPTTIKLGNYPDLASDQKNETTYCCAEVLGKLVASLDFGSKGKFLYVGGVAKGPYTGLTNINLSSDGKHFAYTAFNEKKAVSLILDGQEIIDQDNDPKYYPFYCFSQDNQNVIYDKFQIGSTDFPTYSYNIAQKTKTSVPQSTAGICYKNGNRGLEYQSSLLGALGKFSVEWPSIKDGESYIYYFSLNGKNSPGFDHVWPPRLSADGNQVIYGAVLGKDVYLVKQSIADYQ